MLFNQVADQADREQHDREREPHQRLDDVLQARRRVGFQLQHERSVDDRDDEAEHDGDLDVRLEPEEPRHERPQEDG